MGSYGVSWHCFGAFVLAGCDFVKPDPKDDFSEDFPQSCLVRSTEIRLNQASRRLEFGTWVLSYPHNSCCHNTAV